MIFGFAGSGMSRATKKIEELIWKEHNLNGFQYMYLPTLANPKYNLLV